MMKNQGMMNQMMDNSQNCFLFDNKLLISIGFTNSDNSSCP